VKSETRRRKLVELWEDDDDFDTEEFVELLPSKLNEVERIELAQAKRVAESVIFALTTEEFGIHKVCEVCNNLFLTSYEKVQHCSMRCIKKHLESLGLDFDPTKPPEDWFRPRWVREVLEAGRRRNPEWGPDKPRQPQFLETEKEWIARRDRALRYHPVPLIVPPEALIAIHNLDPPESPEQLLLPTDDQT